VFTYAHKVPVGGAGAQRTFVTSFVQALAPLVKQNKVQLFLNAGDHVHMKEAFQRVLDENQLQFHTISTMDSLKGMFCMQLKPREREEEEGTL
jgi:hypothetical protein